MSTLSECLCRHVKHVFVTGGAGFKLDFSMQMEIVELIKGYSAIGRKGVA